MDLSDVYRNWQLESVWLVNLKNWKFKLTLLKKKTNIFAGTINTYGGGGYVSNLGRTRFNSIIILNFLDEFKWFDVYTRAVIVEYTTFNPNRNLFSLDSVIVEKSATGAIFSNIHVSRHSTFRLTFLSHSILWSF